MQDYLQLLRPRQWLKNVLVWSALIFSMKITTQTVQDSGLAFVAFCLTASTVYILNDLIDAPADRQHPQKKKRPLAAGRIRPTHAVLYALLLAGLSLVISLSLPPSFLWLLSIYILINVLYSLWLKKLLIVDVMVIAIGFVIRVIAGAEALQIQLSPWIVLCTFFASLFLGFGKRKNEGDLLQQNSANHRKVLDHYTPDFLNQLLGITAAMTVISYALYTIDANTIRHFGTANLLYTLPFVVYGIFRYFHLIYNHSDGGDPTQIFSRDYPMIITVLTWLLSFILITYFL